MKHAKSNLPISPVYYLKGSPKRNTFRFIPITIIETANKISEALGFIDFLRMAGERR